MAMAMLLPPPPPAAAPAPLPLPSAPPFPSPAPLPMPPLFCACADGADAAHNPAASATTVATRVSENRMVHLRKNARRHETGKDRSQLLLLQAGRNALRPVLRRLAARLRVTRRRRDD